VRSTDRWAAQKLESILARHDAWVARTLADLHEAGFRENTIRAAYERLDAQREFAGFTQDQIDQALYAMRKRARQRAQEESN
jgi:DNA-binding transcriptional regulator PaaX